MSKYPNRVCLRTIGYQGYPVVQGSSTPVVPCWDLHDTRDERIADSRVLVCYVDWRNSDTDETAQPEPRY